MTNPTPWPCWTCAFRGGPDVTGTYYCTRPSPPLSYAERLRWPPMPEDQPHTRYVGTEQQLRGLTANATPRCDVWEKG